ncbi:MAG: hypothetical protein KDK59_04615 [Simkania sp.]|nr:hypothetical protein [Simkania sp.]
MKIFTYLLSSICLCSGLLFGVPRAFEPQDINRLKPLLNTQRIEYFFKSSGVEVLDIESSAFIEKRVSNLHSVDEDGKKIMRTLAIVDFNQPVPTELRTAHQEIMGGGPIGTTLQKHSWEIAKKPIYFSTIRLSPTVMQWMDETDSNEAAVHIYQLETSRHGSSVSTPYCTIIEIHNPQYLTSEYLEAIYSDQFDQYHEKNDSIDSLISRCCELMEIFPAPKDN